MRTKTTGGRFMVENIQVRQITDCIQEISAELQVAFPQKAKNRTNFFNTKRARDSQKELVIYDEAESDPRFVSDDAVLEPECRSGGSESLGHQNEVRPIERSGGPR